MGTLAEIGLARNSRQSVKSVHARHHDVRDDQIGKIGPAGLAGLHAVFDLGHLHSIGFEFRAHNGAHDIVVIHDQNR